MESLPARASFPSGLSFPLSLTVPVPFPVAPAALELVSGGAEGAAPDPQAALPKAQVRTKARLGTGGALPAQAAAQLQNGGLGRGGDPNPRPGHPGESEGRGAEYPRAVGSSPRLLNPRRRRFSRPLGVGRHGKWGCLRGQGHGPAASARLCPAAAAPWRAGCSGLLQNLAAPGFELRRGRVRPDLRRPREAEVTVAGPGGGPSPQSQPALGVGDTDRASGWWRRKGLQTGGSGGQPRPGTSEGGRPVRTDFWRLPGRPGRTAGAAGETEIGRSLDGARGRPAGLLPGSGARPAQSQYLTRFLKQNPHGKFKLPLVACSHPSSQQSPPRPHTHTQALGPCCPL